MHLGLIDKVRAKSYSQVPESAIQFPQSILLVLLDESLATVIVSQERGSQRGIVANLRLAQKPLACKIATCCIINKNLSARFLPRWMFRESSELQQRTIYTN